MWGDTGCSPAVIISETFGRIVPIDIVKHAVAVSVTVMEELTGVAASGNAARRAIFSVMTRLVTESRTRLAQHRIWHEGRQADRPATPTRRIARPTPRHGRRCKAATPYASAGLSRCLPLSSPVYLSRLPRFRQRTAETSNASPTPPARRMVRATDWPGCRSDCRRDAAA